MGTTMFFGEDNSEYRQKFRAFINDIAQCTFIDIKNETATLLQSFRKVMHDFQVISLFMVLIRAHICTQLSF